MSGRHIVSVSDNTDIKRHGRNGWRVRHFWMPADWNQTGRTISEQWFRSESAARKHAEQTAATYSATLQGID